MEKSAKEFDKKEFLGSLNSVDKFNYLAMPLVTQGAYIERMKIAHDAKNTIKKAENFIEQEFPEVLQGVAKFIAQAGVFALYLPKVEMLNVEHSLAYAGARPNSRLFKT